jgi:hypothetical protein
VSSVVVCGDLRFVDFSRIFLMGILIFKGLTARRLYKSFGLKGLITFYHLIHLNVSPEGINQ